VRRRPTPPSGVQPPDCLRGFVAAEWQVPPLGEHATDWEAEHWPQLGPFFDWRKARRIWSVEHDVLGNFVELFRFQVATRRAHVKGGTTTRE
jgi:hypothetical protein